MRVTFNSTCNLTLIERNSVVISQIIRVVITIKSIDVVVHEFDIWQHVTHTVQEEQVLDTKNCL